MSKPRIIGGAAKGRPLETPRSGTRPTPSRVREALFDILAFYPRGRFLDLFAGSGAVGLEAASRGWRSTLVELDRRAAEVMRRNAQTLGLAAEVVQGDALSFVLKHRGAFDVVFAAPPYPLELPPLFQTILDAGVAKSGGLYVFQHPSGLSLELERGGEALAADRRAYGSNVLSLYRLQEAGAR
jgi:16S rRNA (guanine(966)-N(2))-methyltransferase RsmD